MKTDSEEEKSIKLFGLINLMIALFSFISFAVYQSIFKEQLEVFAIDFTKKLQ